MKIVHRMRAIPSYVRAGIRKCARIRALSQQLHVRQCPAVDVPHGSPVEGPAGVPRQVDHRLPAVLNRWSGNGAIERLFTALQEERIIGAEIRVPAMDPASVKVHQHAAGAPQKGAPGQSASPGEGGTPKFTWYPTARARSSRSI